MANSENETALEIQLAATLSMSPAPSEMTQIMSKKMYAADV